MCQLLSLCLELIPMREPQPERLFDGRRIELSGVGHLDGTGSTAQCHLQGVVAYHPQRGELRRGAECAVAAGRQQQIGLYQVIAFEF
ncbi:hypothetical protein D3C77_597760 [compost metagenome]